MKNTIFVETADGSYIVALLFKLTEDGRIYKQIGSAHSFGEAVRNEKYFYEEALKKAKR